jgi:hypothetical protein
MTVPLRPQKISLEDQMRFLEHMPRSGDPELTLLKGHLLIEEMLQLLICEKVVNPAALEDARLTFYQRLCLAQALYNDQFLEWVWAAVEKLNAVRNKLSHTLKPRDIQTKLDEFVVFVEKEQGTPEPELLSSVFGRVHWALFKVHSALSVQLRVKPILARTILEASGDSTQ